MVVCAEQAFSPPRIAGLQQATLGNIVFDTIRFLDEIEMCNFGCEYPCSTLLTGANLAIFEIR